MKHIKLGFEKRRSLYGYGFIAVWFIGAIIFFMIPLIQSFIYSFYDIKPDAGGMTGEFVGLAKYNYALNEDTSYRGYLLSILKETLWKTPLIMIFSLFIAVVLNQKFRGRTFSRAIFFLPAIIATGPVYSIISGNMSSMGNSGSDNFSTMFSVDLFGEFMNFLGIYDISENVTKAVEVIENDLFGIVWNAGIQILMFMAALQNIPLSSREAAIIEGATEWEYFWKITFPSVSPMILVCFIFTVIDSFTDPENEVMGRIGTMQTDWKYGEASAMAWIYFAIVLAAVGVISLIINKFIYYEVE